MSTPINTVVHSSIPGTVDALVSAFTVATSGVQVVDGEPLDTENDYLAVGFARMEDEQAVTVDDETGDYGTSQTRESYDIACEASSWDGDAVQKTARDRAYSLYGLACGAIAADPTLGGAVMQARISGGGLIQGLAGQGAVATIPFTVHVEAWRTP